MGCATTSLADNGEIQRIENAGPIAAGPAVMEPAAANPVIIDNLFFGYASMKNVIIPDSATGIGDNLFKGHCLMQSVTLPNSIISIGKMAFCDCSALKSVKIPDSVIIIGEMAFGNCSVLQEVIIPPSVTNIAEKTFENCISLKEITIPDSVKKIENRAFKDCRTLKKVTIEDGTASVGEGVFSGCISLKDITLPESVARIGSCAFDGCISLKELVIPESVTGIGEYAFRGCTSLKKLTLPKRFRSDDLNKLRGRLELPYTCELKFLGCEKISADDLQQADEPVSESKLKPITVTPVQQYSGTSNSSAVSDKNEELIIPEGVTKIKKMSPENAHNIKKIILPASLREIGKDAFSEFYDLTEISVSKYNANYTAVNGMLLSKDKTTLIWCPPAKESVEIPESVINIVEIARYSISSVHEINVDKNNKMFSSEDGLLYSKDKTKLILCPVKKQSVTISDAAQEIGEHAFFWCNLKEITIPDSVRHIGERAFFCCSNLQNVTIPEGVETIESYAFDSCGKLKEAIIPDSIKSMENGVFSDCNSLERVVLPERFKNTDLSKLRKEKLGICEDCEIQFRSRKKVNTDDLKNNSKVKIAYVGNEESAYESISLLKTNAESSLSDSMSR